MKEWLPFMDVMFLQHKGKAPCRLIREATSNSIRFEKSLSNNTFGQRFYVIVHRNVIEHKTHL